MSWPARRVTVRLSDVEDGRGGGGGVTEAALFAAYLTQADTLVAQIRRDPPNAAVVSDAGAVVLSAAGQNLRWFALAPAVLGTSSVAASDIPCWDMLAGSAVLRGAPPDMPERASSRGAASDWEGVGCCEEWLNPDETATAILTARPEELTPQQVADWDGQKSAAADGEASTLQDDTAGAGGERQIRKRQQPQQPKKVQKSAKPAIPVGGGLFRSPPREKAAVVDAKEVAAVTSGDPDIAVAASGGDGGAASTSKASGDTAADDRTLLTADTRELSSPSSSSASHISLMRRARAGLTSLPPAPPKLQRALTRGMGLGMQQFGMIKDGDRVLVGLSGGKDSMSMLVLLLGLQARAPVRFELGAVTVDPQYPGAQSVRSLRVIVAEHPYSAASRFSWLRRLRPFPPQGLLCRPGGAVFLRKPRHRRPSGCAHGGAKCVDLRMVQVCQL
jgi:hypothetical protein